MLRMGSLGAAFMAAAVALTCIVPCPAPAGVVDTSPAAATAGSSQSVKADLVGAVADSTSSQPLPAATVIVSQRGTVIARAATDASGHYVIHALPAGEYDVEIQYLSYRTEHLHAQLTGTGEAVDVSARLAALPLVQQTMEVTAAPVALDTRTGDQTFKEDDYHGAPTSTTSQILQQSIAGAVRAPTGEVHIRGQHAEYTYYVDGVPVPSGISGSLNELFDPEIVNQIDFQTGGWDAQYGNRNAAIVNVTTRIPAGGLHASLSGFGGSFGNEGQSFNVSDRSGRAGFFVSASQQGTRMRQEPVLLDPDTNEIHNFSNDGHDTFGFGKLEYAASPHDMVSVDGSFGRTHFAVPYDSTGGAFLDDHQTDQNGFANLSWRHQSSDGPFQRSELFAGAFERLGKLQYSPGITDEPSFVFFPDTLTAYNLREDRHFNTTGLQVDWTRRTSAKFELKTGFLGSVTQGHEDFSTVNGTGDPGPASDSDLKGSDEGVYAQASLAPSAMFELRAGVRFDNHDAPFASNVNQVSPRVRLNFFPDASNTLWLYYGRLFLPTNIEDLRAITSDAQGGTVADPTLPERDHFFEAGFVHRFPVGVVTKLVAYHKRSSPGIDDNTVPGSAIVTSVNLDQVRITGIESVIEVRPSGPLSGYLNAALNHAYGHGPITGGFFPTDNPEGYFDLDHDQRLSIVGNLNYAAHHLFASVTEIYGSGLTNGVEPDASYSTGLFDFDKSIHVDPNYITNGAIGYSFVAGSTVVKPEVYVDNIFDKKYLLKGAFFSGASVGRPRTVEVRLTVAM